MVISSYPDRNGEPAKLNAVACYAQNLLKAYKNRKIVVLAEDKDGKGGVYREGNVLVVGCWKPVDPLMYVRLINTLRYFGKVKNVLIQFEFNMLGSVILTSILPVFMALLRMIGKNITVMQHQVVDDLAMLGGHLNVKKGSLKNTILNFGLRSFYVGLGMFSNAIIVHEETLKDRLARWVPKDKIFVVSHGLSINGVRGDSREKIRKSLGIKESDFVLLTFGYIAWYKGVDWLIKKVGEMVKTNPNLKLIVAGGPSATLQSKAHYRRYLAKVSDLAQKYSKNVIMTGFVPDGDVYKYFRASDLSVLPYRAMMSASGPLSFALKFRKPFVISKVLKEAYRNPDMQTSFEVSGTKIEDITFGFGDNSFEKIVKNYSNKSRLQKIKVLSSSLRRLRSWENIVLEYEKVIWGIPEYSIIGALKRIGSKLPRFSTSFGMERNA